MLQFNGSYNKTKPANYEVGDGLINKDHTIEEAK